MQRRVLNQIERTIVDIGTGEVMQTDNIIEYRVPKEPPYVKLYIDDISKLVGLSNGSNAVLMELVRRMNYEDGIVTITKPGRARIAERTGLSDGTIKNKLSELVKVGIMTSHGCGEYEMNPNLFARGDWSDIYKRRNNFRMQIDYIDGERKISGSII